MNEVLAVVLIVVIAFIVALAFAILTGPGSGSLQELSDYFLDLTEYRHDADDTEEKD